MNTEAILNFTNSKLDEFIYILKQFVELESPTFGEKAELDRCGDYTASLFRDLGCQVSFFPQEKTGNCFKAEIGDGPETVMLLGHYDTVFPVGSVGSNMPFKIVDDRIYGPGVMDMKGGILAMYFAIRALKELGIMPKKKIRIMINGDEESGSRYSRDLIVREALGCKAVFVLEPAPAYMDASHVKTGRYGKAVYKVIAHGKAGHSGNNAHEAASSLVEIAKQLAAINEMGNKYEGLISSPTYMEGGIENTAMIPGLAKCAIDMRALNTKVAAAAGKELKELKPYDERVKLEIIEETEKLPLECNDELFALVERVGREFGLEMKKNTVGGGSDGNYTCSAGIPTIDGLGMTGAYIHNENEHIYKDEIAVRIAILVRLIQEV